jgi:hypothetical protein
MEISIHDCCLFTIETTGKFMPILSLAEAEQAFANLLAKVQNYKIDNCHSHTGAEWQVRYHVDEPIANCIPGVSKGSFAKGCTIYSDIVSGCAILLRHSGCADKIEYI